MGVVKELWNMNDTIQYLQKEYESGNISETALADTVQSITDNAKDNLQSLANWYRNMDDDEARYDKAIKELQDLKKHCKSQKEFIKKVANETLATLGVKSFTAGLSKFTTRPSQRLEVSEDANIPSEYWKQQEPKLDKAKLKEDVKQGFTFDGVTLETHRNVTIK